MTKKTLDEIEVGGLRALVRVDFNVPLKDGVVVDDTRMRAALPTLCELREKSARIILMSHLGRPGGEAKDALRLDPVAERLRELLAAEVVKVDEVCGPAAAQAVEDLREGQLLLLENTRFHPGEKSNDATLSKELAKLGDVFVNDAFAACHRAHASTAGVAAHLPACAGRLLQKEVEALSSFLADAPSPTVGVFGGAKVPDKLAVIEALEGRLERILLGGGMANTFLAAIGQTIGDSLADAESVEVAKKLFSRLPEGRIILPEEVVALTDPSDPESHRTVRIDEMKDDWRIVDLGAKTLETYEGVLREAQSVIWNGPLGWIEQAPFDAGTHSLARMLSGLSARVVVGGGETVQAARDAGQEDRYDHLSTGGGAFLAFLAGKELPGIEALDERDA